MVVKNSIKVKNSNEYLSGQSQKIETIDDCSCLFNNYGSTRFRNLAAHNWVDEHRDFATTRLEIVLNNLQAFIFILEMTFETLMTLYKYIHFQFCRLEVYSYEFAHA